MEALLAAVDAAAAAAASAGASAGAAAGAGASMGAGADSGEDGSGGIHIDRNRHQSCTKRSARYVKQSVLKGRSSTVVNDLCVFGATGMRAGGEKVGDRDYLLLWASRARETHG